MKTAVPGCWVAQVLDAGQPAGRQAHAKVFAVCPVSLTADEEHALRQSDASFQQVHPSCKVTLSGSTSAGRYGCCALRAFAACSRDT